MPGKGVLLQPASQAGHPAPSATNARRTSPVKRRRQGEHSTMAPGHWLPRLIWKSQDAWRQGPGSCSVRRGGPRFVLFTRRPGIIH